MGNFSGRERRPLLFKSPHYATLLSRKSSISSCSEGIRAQEEWQSARSTQRRVCSGQPCSAPSGDVLAPQRPAPGALSCACWHLSSVGKRCPKESPRRVTSGSGSAQTPPPAPRNELMVIPALPYSDWAGESLPRSAHLGTVGHPVRNTPLGNVPVEKLASNFLFYKFLI